MTITLTPSQVLALKALNVDPSYRVPLIVRAA